MRSLQDMGLVKLVKADKTVFFYKAIPMTVEAEKLAVFRISINQYREAFQLLDARLTDMQRGAAEVNHPDKNSYKRFCDSNNLGHNPLSQNFRKFWYRIKWNGIFRKICFENSRQPLEVVLFSENLEIPEIFCTIWFMPLLVFLQRSD